MKQLARPLLREMVDFSRTIQLPTGFEIHHKVKLVQNYCHTWKLCQWVSGTALAFSIQVKVPLTPFLSGSSVLSVQCKSLSSYHPTQKQGPTHTCWRIKTTYKQVATQTSTEAITHFRSSLVIPVSTQDALLDALAEPARAQNAAFLSFAVQPGTRCKGECLSPKDYRPGTCECTWVCEHMGVCTHTHTHTHTPFSSFPIASQMTSLQQKAPRFHYSSSKPKVQNFQSY